MPKLHKVMGQPSWTLTNDVVQAFVTQKGGHIGPVTFQLGRRKIQPFSVAPWAEKPDPKLPAILQVLRGDFFCLPFGGNSKPFRGERHPVHGETANASWTVQSAAPGQLHLSLKTKTRAGRVDKQIMLHPGHTAVYQRHILSGMTGPMNPGHHAMLKFPESGGILSTSPFVWGGTAPVLFEDPAQGGYSSLAIGAPFKSLEKVPMTNGDFADLTHYPARHGFEDLVMIAADATQPLAWTAVVFPTEGYVWFALKDPRVLRQTVFWISNKGRHYPPWNGCHSGVMGLEEVTSYFHYGLAESAAKNPVNAKGIPTCLHLNPRNPVRINYIMAVAAIPPRFDKVKTIVPAPDRHAVKLTSRNGSSIIIPLDLTFLELS